ncbi:phosphoribosyl-ATP pyrophosphatase /phosphoribosyl-AMP cyclohydrolase [Picrophilus oshimae DSM 9789]|uniref:Histidine biosynthesis bifunctional protein HisIE n=2 Tax=Picrophilus torridus (strain ATCC 700027 / DSM 9790 / JCM 10055 / NBRC 100828 / KAW 2/3) TaxID=1122961 RepID=A0A8G2FX02_PICTO|nr:phosphoribosyl-ATP pyrophosphatase /phosphoribosyl-AMP cyclohydrolase [Picrophilus oshimae DSM 9789]
MVLMSDYNINFNDGIVPVVVQDFDTGDVLTLAYMDRNALEMTMKTGYAFYYSRSMKRIHMKGEVSGNTQKVMEIYQDCNDNSLLIKVKKDGPACHTGNNSCFYRKLGEPKVDGNIDYSLEILLRLEDLVRKRMKDPVNGSYTNYLIDSGDENIRKKVGEEAIETILASGRDRIVYETADLLYHLIVFLAFNNVSLFDVMNELNRRSK